MEVAADSDEALMQQVACGKREPLSLLLRRYATPLLTFLRRVTGDHHLSEELFQDAFLAVWTGSRTYRFPAPFKPWLFGIAMNKCRAWYRRRGEWDLHLNGAETAMAPNASPPDAAMAVETSALVEQAVRRLPVAQRTVVVLKMWNDLSYSEIAAQLECAESTVRSNMFYGLASMRKFLEPRLR